MLELVFGLWLICLTIRVTASYANLVSMAQTSAGWAEVLAFGSMSLLGGYRLISQPPVTWETLSWEFVAFAAGILRVTWMIAVWKDGRLVTESNNQKGG